MQKADTNMTADIETLNDSLESTVTGLNTSLDSLYLQIRNSEVNFAAERILYDRWPFDTMFNYDIPLADSHNAMNFGLGIFTAPVNGTYTFFFYSRMNCENNVGVIYVVKNEVKTGIFECDEWVPGDGHHASSTVIFTMQLTVGDQVGVNSGSASLYNYSKLSGFLLPSF